MKRIGILTFHKNINFGAYMQCYSLSHKLQNDFPDCKIEVIDYIPKRVQDSINVTLSNFIFGSNKAKTSLRTKLIRIRSLLKNPKILHENKMRVQGFMRGWRYLPLSEKQYTGDDFNADLLDIAEKYDAVIVGSDCVWEYIADPFPNIYFLHCNAIKNKFSFAASSDRMYYPNITKNQADYIRDALSRYRYIGVRDAATENFIHAISTELQLSHNCDPTVLLDINSLPENLDRVKNILTKRGIDLTKPIIGIMGDDNIGDLIRCIFGRKYQVVAVYTNVRAADCYLEDLSPIEWAKVFSLFSVTFTRFFHGTILSLKNGTPTITLDPWKMKDENHVTKIKDLYTRLHLEEHYFLRKKKYSPEELCLIKERTEQFMVHPDKEKIEIALAKEAENYNHLRNALTSWLATS